jgi:DNA-binding CsgD family transcriptional regulator
VGPLSQQTIKRAMQDLIGVLEAAYAVDGDDRSWLAGLLEAMRGVWAAGASCSAFLSDRSDPGYLVMDPVVLGLPPALSGMLAGGMRASGDRIRSLGEDGPAVATASSVLGERWAQLLPVLQSTLASAGVADVFTLRCEDLSGLGCTLSVTLPEMRRLSRAEVDTWSRVVAHVVAGRRLRYDAAAHTTEAILTPGGKVEHAEGPARDRDARARLARATIDIVRARGRMRRTSPREAVETWRALVSGRWSILDHFDGGGRRYLVARRNEPAAVSRSVEVLSPREREVVAYAALGHANKLIGYELGIATTTVANALASAAGKLGVSTRAELIRRFREAS